MPNLVLITENRYQISIKLDSAGEMLLRSYLTNYFITDLQCISYLNPKSSKIVPLEEPIYQKPRFSRVFDISLRSDLTNKSKFFSKRSSIKLLLHQSYFQFCFRFPIVSKIKSFGLMMDKWITSTCKANGINIHYHRTGGDKSPIILLHGLMTSGACWMPVARLLEAEYDVIMPDARGHGYSTAPSSGYLYNNHAEDVLGLINSLALDSPVLVGHSMGGMTAAEVAAKNPHLLSGLVLADPTFLSPQMQQEVFQSDVGLKHQEVLNQPKAVLMESMRNRPKKRTEEMIQIFADARFQTSLDAFEVLTPPNPDYQKLIQAIDTPSLLVIGDMGNVVSKNTASELAALNSKFKVVQIQDAGHSMRFDQPEHFAKTLMLFCKYIKTYES